MPPAMTKTAPDAEEKTEIERWMLCVECGARVTPLRAKISVNGAHEHELMNPAGMRFFIQCFSEAPGARGDGFRSAVWTWFPGFAWEAAECASCHVHLGWAFHGSSTFHGFIRERVIEQLR